VCWCAEAQPAHTALCAGAGHPALQSTAQHMCSAVLHIKSAELGYPALAHQKWCAEVTSTALCAGL